MKYIILILSIFPIFILAQAGSIKGKVTDVETGKPLIGANLSIQSTQKGAATINNGEYWITKLSAGKYDIAVSYLGYKTIIIKDVEIPGQEPTELNVSLPRNNNFQMPEEMESFYLEQIPNNLKNKLEELKKINKTEYYRNLQETYFNYILQNDKSNKLESEILELEVELKLIALNYQKASTEEKEKLKQGLMEKLSYQYDLKQKLRLQDLSDLTKKIEILQKSINDSKNKKGIYINEKAKLLLGN